MKKYPFLLILPLLLSSCTSGEEKKNSIPLFHYDPIHIEIDSNQDTMFYSLQTSELDTWIKEKRSFPIYVWAQGCGACDAFGLSLKDYVNQNNLCFPFIYLSSYVEVKNSLSIDQSSLLFYKNGKLIDYKSDFSDIGSSKDLTKYMNQYVYDTNVTLLNSSYVNSNLKTTFNTYSLNSYVSDPKKDTNDFIQVPLDSFSLKQKSCLFVNETKEVDYSLLYQTLLKTDFDYLAFNGEEFNTDYPGINAYYPFSFTEIDKTKTYTFLTLNGDVIMTSYSDTLEN